MRFQKNIHRRLAFTLIELLVVVAIIALLIGILLPSLGAAKRTARTVICGTNLRNVGRGIATYVSEFGAFPASYYWVGQLANNSLGAVTDPSNGIVHWSYFLYKADSSQPGSAATTAGQVGTIPAKAFICPEFPDRGGLPPTNTTPDNQDANHPNEVPGIVDFQVPRLAYTLNEAIAPKNRFVPGLIQGQLRTNRWVRPTEIKGDSITILGTEWTTDSSVVMGESVTGSGDAAGYVLKSHWPVSGFKGADPEPTRWYPPGGALGNHETYYRDTPSDIVTAPPPPAENNPNQLSINMIGHNHGGGSYANRKANFVFVDGHVEAEKVSDTVSPNNFQWGTTFMSLSPVGPPS